MQAFSNNVVEVVELRQFCQGHISHTGEIGADFGLKLFVPRRSPAGEVASASAESGSLRWPNKIERA